jgi:hypothetical protein
VANAKLSSAGRFSFLFRPRRAGAPPTNCIHLGEVSALR